MSRMRIAVGLALTMVLLATSVALAGTVVVPTEVLGGPGHQLQPFTNGAYFAYTEETRQNGNWYDNAYLRTVATGHTVRLNSARKGGWTGSFDPGTNRVIFQQWNAHGSELRIYDADTHSRSTPGAVNSPRWEWSPLMSSRFITYFENRGPNEERVLLRIYDRMTHDTRTIDEWMRRRSLELLENGSVGEQYASWTVCTSAGGCSAHVYDSVTHETAKIPSPADRHEYAPVVDELNSLVYFTRGRSGCGRSADIYAQALDLTGTATRIVELPGGIDTGWTASIYDNPVTHLMDLYYAQIDCDRNLARDIWVAAGVAPGTP